MIDDGNAAAGILSVLMRYINGALHALYHQCAPLSHGGVLCTLIGLGIHIPITMLALAPCAGVCEP